MPGTMARRLHRADTEIRRGHWTAILLAGQLRACRACGSRQQWEAPHAASAAQTYVRPSPPDRGRRAWHAPHGPVSRLCIFFLDFSPYGRVAPVPTGPVGDTNRAPRKPGAEEGLPDTGLGQARVRIRTLTLGYDPNVPTVTVALAQSSSKSASVDSAGSAGAKLPC